MATRHVFGALICTCERCGHVWVARSKTPPAACASCKRAQWRTPRPAPAGTRSENPEMQEGSE